MPAYHVLIPAAGGGSRMNADRPKQYLPLLGEPMLRHTLRIFARQPEITGLHVVLAPEDEWWATFDWSEFDRLDVLRCGGATRADSVHNGLQAIGPVVQPEDWVLVHDAARPCLDRASLERLLKTLADDPCGGILAVPVADTLKRADSDQTIQATVSRDRLWAAQTPQMYRYQVLLNALTANRHLGLTDEAQAVEAHGLPSQLVPGSNTNFKVTWPDDLALAALILAARTQGES